jgi:radical SAM-linked protein
MNSKKTRCRITFSKLGSAKFVGHLDLQTLFQRTIKRAGLPVAYSKGFNPHQLISFAQPLSVGMEGLREIADIELTEHVEPKTIIDGLNSTLPRGFSIISARFIPHGEKRAAAAVYAARYRLIFHVTNNLIKEAVEYLSANQEPPNDKILSMTYNQAENSVEMLLCAGGERNLKPALAAAYICERIGIAAAAGTFSCTRTEILFNY